MKKLSAKKVTGIIVSLLLLVVCILCYCIFSKSQYKKYVKNSSTNVFTKLKAMDNSKESIELDEADLNQLLDFALVGKVTKGNVNVEKAWVHINDDKITIYALTDYKNLQVVLNTTGKMSYNGDIVYIPEEFKIGKLPIPKEKVLNKLQDLLKGKVTIEGQNIVLYKKNFPLNLTNVALKNDKLTVMVKEPLTKQFLNKMNKDITDLYKQIKDKNLLEKINKARTEVVAMEKELTNNNQIVLNELNDSDKKATSSNSNQSSATVKKSSSKSSLSSANVKASLDRAAGQLSAAKGAVSSSGGQQIIDIMMGAVSTLRNNPKYNYSGDMGEAIGIYKTLTPEQKKNLKAAIYSNVDVGNAMQLRSMFGI